MRQGHGAKSASGDSQDYAYNNPGSPQKTQVFRPQPSTVHHAAAPENTPPRSQGQHQSRMPIVNAAANSRAAGAAAARLPMAASRPNSARPSHQISHSKEAASLSVQRNRGASAEPLQNVQRQVQAQTQGPFWEGSTIEGSTLSETASNADQRLAVPSRVPYSDTAFKSRNMSRHQTKRDSDADRAPFVIGENGFINVIDSSSPLTRRSSTPEVRARAASKGLSPDFGDPYVEETRYQTDLEKTPPNTLNHRGARLPLRATKRETFAERTIHPPSATAAYSSPEQAYQAGDMVDYGSRDTKNHLRAPAPAHEAHRSTMFENLDTPIASHQDLPESDIDLESVDDQPTPKAAAKSSQPLPQHLAQPPAEPLNRRLFTADSKASKTRNSLGESSMPRLGAEKRQSKNTTKKRSFDLDYDDSALAAMKYSELKNQDFDFDPAQAESHSAQRPAQGTLPEKLDHFLGKDTATQAAFFTSLPVRDWDDSGDWFLERFGDIMHRLKETRKTKRKLVDDFEAEIAEREDAVRNKMHGIDHTLSELRSEGEVMMKNKELE